MTTILVIDDDAESRQYVREAAPADWTILEANTGLSGIDMVREWFARLDLIVLDMNLPDIEGRSVCARIREMSVDVPILPFTALSRTVPALTEMGCLPAIIKPVRPSSLRAALQAAPSASPPPVTASSLLGWVLEQSGRLEQQARQDQVVTRVAVFASSQIKRAGLARMLGLTAQVVEATTLATLQRLLAGMRVSALVTDATDYISVGSLAQEYGIPLILIVPNATQVQAYHTPDVAAVVLETDPAAGVRLGQALEAIVAGERYVHLPVDLRHAPGPGQVLPAMVARLFDATPLTTREQEVVWLDRQGLSATQIATYLAIDPQTVASHWKGAQRKMHMGRSELRRWLQEHIQDRAHDDKTSSAA